MLLRLHWSLIFSSPCIWRRPFLPSSTNKHTNRACARRIPEGNDFAKSDAYTKYDNMLLLGTLFACDWRSIRNPITSVGQQGQQGYTNPPPLNSSSPTLSLARSRARSLPPSFCELLTSDECTSNALLHHPSKAVLSLDQQSGLWEWGG